MAIMKQTSADKHEFELPEDLVTAKKIDNCIRRLCCAVILRAMEDSVTKAKIVQCGGDMKADAIDFLKTKRVCQWLEFLGIDGKRFRRILLRARKQGKFKVLRNQHLPAADEIDV